MVPFKKYHFKVLFSSWKRESTTKVPFKMKDIKKRGNHFRDFPRKNPYFMRLAD